MQDLPPNAVRRRACRTSCIVTTAHVFVTCLVIFWRQFDKYPSCWSVEIRPPHENQCHNLSSALTRGDLRQHCFQRLQWRCRRVHLARTLGFPGCPLSVSAHSVLMGAFSVSRRHTSLSDFRVHLMTTDVLHFFSRSWRTALGQATRLCCHPNAILPTS